MGADKYFCEKSHIHAVQILYPNAGSASFLIDCFDSSWANIIRFLQMDKIDLGCNIVVS